MSVGVGAGAGEAVVRQINLQIKGATYHLICKLICRLILVCKLIRILIN